MSQSEWWGSTAITQGRVVRWRIGPLTLWVQRLDREWRVAYARGPDPLDATLELLQEVEVEELDRQPLVERIAEPGASDRLLLTPLLADRPVVSRPERPFRILAGEAATLYVGSPLWLRLATVDPERDLVALPIFRPSDTWFGPTTGGGELCYASRTHCRVRLDDVPVRPHRATTAVSIQNHADDALTVERLKLPAPNLTIYRGREGRVWTPDLTLERRQGEELARVTIAGHPPSQDPEAELLAPPREPASGSLVTRAFSTIFG